jgi:hypothetical protein
MKKRHGEEHEKTIFQDENEFLERMARYYTLDAIRCTLHNKGYELEGNTEETDITWFARNLYEADGERFHWDQVPQDVRERYIKLATTVLKILPRLASRISSRWIAISQAINTQLKAEKLDKWYQEQENHPARNSRI